MGYFVIGDTMHYPDLYILQLTVHRRLDTQKAYIIIMYIYT